MIMMMIVVVVVVVVIVAMAMQLITVGMAVLMFVAMARQAIPIAMICHRKAQVAALSDPRCPQGAHHFFCGGIWYVAGGLFWCFIIGCLTERYCAVKHPVFAHLPG